MFVLCHVLGGGIWVRKFYKRGLIDLNLKNSFQKGFLKNQDFSKMGKEKFIVYVLDSIFDVTLCLYNKIKYGIMNNIFYQ